MTSHEPDRIATAPQNGGRRINRIDSATDMNPLDTVDPSGSPETETVRAGALGRRRLLRALGVASVRSMAGCTGSPGENGIDGGEGLTWLDVNADGAWSLQLG